MSCKLNLKQTLPKSKATCKEKHETCSIITPEEPHRMFLETGVMMILILGNRADILIIATCILSHPMMWLLLFTVCILER